jgi:glycosyltransferase involved in cell wall biosynthesis
MRILYFSSRECWPPNTGGRLRDFHLARELARYARVTYVGLRNPLDPPSVAPPADAGFEEALVVEKDKEFTPVKLIQGVIGPDPVTVLNCWFPRAGAELERVMNSGEPFDSVQVEGMHLVRYLPMLRKARGKPGLLGDWHNIESEIMWRYSERGIGLPKQVYARRTAALIEGAERRLLQGCDVHVVCSSREKGLLGAQVPEARIEIVGNGVDAAHYAGLGESGSERRDVLYVGSMDYHANIDAVVHFANTAWPQIRAVYPDLRFVISGRNPAAEVRALGSTPDIHVTGTLDDIRPSYQTAFAVVVPLRTGSGTRLKILEAMAAGVPVVSTRLGAEGLTVTDGLNLILAETPQEMTAAVRRLKESPGERERLVTNALRLVRDQYDWPILGKKLFEIHSSLSRRP